MKSLTPSPFAFLRVLRGLIFFVCIPFAAAELRVYPESITLDGARDTHSVVVQFVDPDGGTQDVSSIASYHVTDQDLANWQNGTLHPTADGQTKLKVRFATYSAAIPVQIENATTRRPVSFELDVMPVFMRAGCNTGSCHGSARGQDGFMLSLFGYDPDGDFLRLTRELPGRRVNVAAPAQSLLLEKAVGDVTHTGGDLFKPDTEYYQTLHEWIVDGAQPDEAGAPEVTGLELFPPKLVVDENPEQTPAQQMLVRANYSDGTKRDVTSLAVFLTNNDSVADVDDHGLARGLSAGGAFVFARFDKFTVGSEMVVLPESEVEWTQPPANNDLDTLVYSKLKKLKLPPSELTADASFLRRLYIDLVGVPPTPAEFYAFVEDEDPDKRTKLIDDLLARDEFVDLWAMKWGEMLTVKAGNDVRGGRPRKAAWKYYQWLREQIKSGRPADEMVADLIAASGSNLTQPVANFYTSSENQAPTPLQRGENIAQLFLGTRIQCAQCHNHPFDRWTQDDYYGFVSFFAGVSSKSGANAQEVYIYNNNGKNTVEHPLDGRQVKPKFLGGDAPDIDGKDPRAALAEWMTSADNKVFAQNLANRAWAHFFGRGIVEPVDDMRITNPPSNQELLDALGEKLIAYDFDMRKLVKEIVSSRTYQLSSSANEHNARDDRYFSRGYVRRMQAEVLLDTISAATDTVTSFSRTPREFRATELFEGAPRGDYFLETFGAARRETVCACEVSKEANLAQALHLINGSTLTNKLRESQIVKDMVESSAPPEEIIEQLYIRTLCRKPTGVELDKMLHAIGPDAEDEDANVRRAAYDDLFWSLLNSTEFAFNH